ncbi:MAG: pgtB [Bacteroidetes bacterium]|nr:pgtB [Bacteroidota bacterium]
MKYTLFLLAFYFHTIGVSQNTLEYSDSKGYLQIGGSSLFILEDPSNNLNPEQVLKSDKFARGSQDVPNLGVSKSNFWLKLKIKNISENNKLLLTLAYPNLEMVQLYVFLPSQQFTQTMGKHLPFKTRSYNSPNYIFDLPVKKDSVAEILIKIKGGGQIMAPVYIGNEKHTSEKIRSDNLFVGIYCGVILVMFFYNLFIYFIIKDNVYFYYVAYILAVGLVQICLLGYTFQFLWPNSAWLARHSVNLLSPISCIAIIEFIKVFLRTKYFTPALHKGLNIFNGTYLLYIILDLLNLSENAYGIIQLCAMLLSLYILYLSFVILKKKYRPAKFLFFSWMIFLIGVFVYALKDVGILPYNSYTIFTMPVGSAIETALLSFALADRINIFKKEKEESQAKTLELLLENESILKSQKELLERKVGERTSELELVNKNLKEAQAHLVNVEKMASIGQLTAGISHEINNPINFVISNIAPLKRNINDVLLVLNNYDKIENNDNLVEKINEIKKLKKDLEINYVVNETEQLLNGIEEGALRTSEIVKGLQHFSRINEVELSECNIHEGIDSTLTILKNPLNSENITVEKNYGSLAVIEGYPGKLNQVFMNILINAVQAIAAKKYKNKEGKIIISTKPNNQYLEIIIKDNGIGIPKENINKLFDPFFTTKKVGMGTGLGLSIVYGIINSHHGHIEIKSSENEGAEFILSIPFKAMRI